jgi:DNA (cytosine-5)-methyltransferase 1
MNELALFAGAGGGILGGKLLGWRTVCAVEIGDYARRVLLSRQDDGSLPPFPIWDDVRTFDGCPWRGVVDIVTGGFPCQDISAAGKGAGIEGERSGLWGEMARIIGEVRPRYALVENSPVLTSRGLGVVLGDLAAMGYDARWGVLGAVHAGAPHKRERIWIVADSEGFGERSGTWSGLDERGREQLESTGTRCDADHGGEASVADADSSVCRRGADQSQWEKKGRVIARGCGEGLSDTEDTESRRRRDGTGWRSGSPIDDDGAGAEGTDWWFTEPDVGRVAHGVAARVDRLRALGNGQVPAVVALAWRILNTEND